VAKPRCRGKPGIPRKNSLPGTGPPLANPYSMRDAHRSPPARAGGTAGRWAIPASGSPPNRSPPTRPNRVHNHAGSGHARAASPGRSLQASCPPLARCWLALSLPAFTSPATPAPRHGPTPREPLFRARADAIKAPRREPGGRRAVGRSQPPEARRTVHHQHAQTAFTTKTATGHPQPTTHNPQPTTHNPQPTTHNPPTHHPTTPITHRLPPASHPDLPAHPA